MHVVIYFSELRRLCRSSRGFLISLFQWIFLWLWIKIFIFFSIQNYTLGGFGICISLSFICENITIK